MLEAWMRLFLPISVSCGGVVTHLGPVGGVIGASDGWGCPGCPAKRGLSLSAGSPALNCGGQDVCFHNDDN